MIPFATTTRERGRDVRLPARLTEKEEFSEMNDVAIIGVGLHPFGRFEKTAMQMGAEAIQAALDDAGID